MHSPFAPPHDPQPIIEAIRRVCPEPSRLVEMFASDLALWRSFADPRPLLIANFRDSRWQAFWSQIRDQLGQMQAGIAKHDDGLLYRRAQGDLGVAVRFAVDVLNVQAYDLASPSPYAGGTGGGALWQAHTAMNPFHYVHMSAPWRNMLQHRQSHDVLLVLPPSDFDEADALHDALAQHTACPWVHVAPDGNITTNIG